MKIILMLLVMGCLCGRGNAQVLSGNLKAHAGQRIGLVGFNYMEDFILDEGRVDSLGNFKLTYGKEYQGMGYLQTEDNSLMVVVLTDPNIRMEGTHLKEVEGVLFRDSPANVDFARFVEKNIQNLQVYQAWRYLQPLYDQKLYLKAQTGIAQTIGKEIARIETADATAIGLLPKDSYLSWYLPLQLLVNSMPMALTYMERIEIYSKEFRAIDFTDARFKTGGVLKQLLEGHYILLENSGRPLDEVYKEMNTSTDYLINSLKKEDKLLGMVTKHLFAFLESRSLFEPADYLANRILEDGSCRIEGKIANRLEKYRRLKVGNTAADFQLGSTKKLSEVQKNIVLVFGSSSCSHCKDELGLLKQRFEEWRQSNLDVELVYISTDTDKQSYDGMYVGLPWLMYCDFKGWEGKVVKEYAVYATPTYFVLDKELKIQLHPSGLAHLDAWVKQRCRKS